MTVIKLNEELLQRMGENSIMGIVCNEYLTRGVMKKEVKLVFADQGASWTQWKLPSYVIPALMRDILSLRELGWMVTNKLRLKMLALESFLAKEFDIENEILWDALLEAGVPEDLL